MRAVPRIIVCLALAAGLFCTAGCEKAKQMSVAGTYVSELNPKKYRELKADGTFFAQEEVASLTGTFEIEGSQITLKFTIGTAVRATLDGETMIDSRDGERWTKK